MQRIENKAKKEMSTTDSNYLNFTNRSFKKVLIENPSQLDYYYQLERERIETEESNVDVDNKLNLISKFRNKQIKKFKEQQQIDRRLYIREQVDELDYHLDQAISSKVKKTQEKRRILDIAMGTGLPPDRKIFKSAFKGKPYLRDEERKYETLQGSEKAKIKNYSRNVADAVEAENERNRENPRTIGKLGKKTLPDSFDIVVSK
uniref:Uncharacterized protein n=1 Tax=Euplotes harpa TaxID=151035 RepID=A0A7S3ND06_9SPIT|mmetsp:Transcript_38426/g.44040  ORF Transcript_38426/g.44040 Transcript_38426/m.44040 type:complete len:204 (+) Transcript_38426:988-1599(+)